MKNDDNKDEEANDVESRRKDPQAQGSRVEAPYDDDELKSDDLLQRFKRATDNQDSNERFKNNSLHHDGHPANFNNSDDGFGPRFVTVVDLNLNLVPQLLPWKLGSALLLQYILHEKNNHDDKIGLLTLAFSAGVISLAIMIHASFMTYALQSFGTVWSYIPARIKRVKRLAQIFNVLLVLAEAGLVSFIFFYCAIHYSSAQEEFRKRNGMNIEAFNELYGRRPEYVEFKVFLFTFIVSAVTFGGTIIAIFLSVFLICFEGQLYAWLKSKYPRRLRGMSEGKTSIPKAANYIIDEGLSTVLINVFIGMFDHNNHGYIYNLIFLGIDENDVGEAIYLKTFSLAVGMITMAMSLFNTIITYAMQISVRDGKLDAIEVKLIQVFHVIRYVMAGVQVILLGVMLYQASVTTFGVVDTKQGPYEGPTNLFNLTFVLSLFVVIAVFITAIQIIYMKGCSGKEN